jgi:hypothetical protein
MKKFLMLFTVMVVISSVSFAREPVSLTHKSLFTQLSMDFSLPTKTYYDGDSKAMPSGFSREYSENYYRLAITYGLLEKLNFDFGFRIWQADRSVPSKERQLTEYHLTEATLKEGVDKTRLLDFEVGFRLPIKEFFFKHSLAASILIPTSNKIDPEPYNIGDGRFALRLRYLFEKEFGVHTLYGDTGFVFNDERLENQYILDVNYAYTIMKGLYAGIGLNIILPLSMEDNTNPFETVPQDVGAFKIVPRVGYSPLENLNIELNYSYTLGGFNTYLFNTIGLNASYLF